MRIFSFIQGVEFIINDDIGQAVGMGVAGLIFMAVGGAVSYFFRIKGASNNE